MTEMTMDEATAAEVGEVMGRLLGDFAAASGTVLATVGQRLGLWEALSKGPGTAAEIASRAGAAVPYVREWLRSQTAAGYVRIDPVSGDFSITPAVSTVFTGEPLAGLTKGMALQLGVYWAELDSYEEAFRSGAGISWSALPEAHAAGMDLITRAVVAPALVGEWLPAVPGLTERLAAGAAVADVGCGYGAATIAMAETFPASTFLGVDADEASISRARRAAEEAGVADRVTFEVLDARRLHDGPFDLVVFIDAIHDLGDPVRALSRSRSQLADGGSVLLVEHAGSDRAEDNVGPVARFFYAASMLVCVPNALADHGEPLGSIPGEAALRGVAAQAGFSAVSTLDVGAPINLVMNLRV